MEGYLTKVELELLGIARCVCFFGDLGLLSRSNIYIGRILFDGVLS